MLVSMMVRCGTAYGSRYVDVFAYLPEAEFNGAQ
jgi:hypothetical protein